MILVMRKPAVCKCENKGSTSIRGKNISIYMGVRQFGPFICKKNQKIGAFINFLSKNHIPGSSEKGAIRRAQPYYVIYRELYPHAPGS